MINNADGKVFFCKKKFWLSDLRAEVYVRVELGRDMGSLKSIFLNLVYLFFMPKQILSAHKAWNPSATFSLPDSSSPLVADFQPLSVSLLIQELQLEVIKANSGIVSFKK